MSDEVLPTGPQLVRFSGRVSKARDGLDSAENCLRDALSVFDGDTLQVKQPFSLAYAYARQVKEAICALNSLLAVADMHADDQRRALASVTAETKERP